MPDPVTQDNRFIYVETPLGKDKLLLLSGHEGERDVETICRESALSDYEACRTIWAFRVIGVLKQVPPAP